MVFLPLLMLNFNNSVEWYEVKINYGDFINFV